MRFFRYLNNPLCVAMALCIFCTGRISAQDQNRIITGSVTDKKDGTPIQGVSVIALGTRLGVQTDSLGNFKIGIPINTSALRFSSIGFVTIDKEVSKNPVIQVEMEGLASSLKDVVLIGYGSTLRKDVTGAVSSIKTRDFNPGILASPMQQIQGKIAGLSITQATGDPNGEPTVRLRGATHWRVSHPCWLLMELRSTIFIRRLKR